ncbi:MAG: hypothetical protein H7Y03_14665 [Chitinophagaceae bacterium]|nr:hypothetical protein [Chitinophagaceae bacterium]
MLQLWTIRYYVLYSRRNKGKVDKILKITRNKIPEKSWKEKIEGEEQERIR